MLEPNLSKIGLIMLNDFPNYNISNDDEKIKLKIHVNKLLQVHCQEHGMKVVGIF